MSIIEIIKELIQESSTNKLGLCLRLALQKIKKNRNLKLFQGPPGQSGDTSHFWVVDKNNNIIDPSRKINPNIVPKNYQYKGRQVNPESILKELDITWNDIK